MANSFGDVVNFTNQAAQGNQAAQRAGADEVTNYISTAQDLAAKQQKAQALQQQLDETKFQTLMSRIQTQNAIQDPHIQKQVAMQNEKAGIAAPGFFTTMHKSDDLQQGWSAAADYIAGNPVSPEQKKQAVMTAMDPTTWHTVPTMFQERQKNEAMVAAQQLKTSATVRGQDVGLQGKELMANAMSNRVNTTGASQWSRQYKSEIGPAESALNQANRANDIIGKIQDGDLKSTKTLAADLDSAQASLLGGGKPSTVYGQQAVHMDDVYSRAANTMQFLTANPQDTQSPAKLEQLKKDVAALSEFYSKQHEQQYNAFRQKAPEQFRDRLDSSYQMFREQHGLPAHIYEPGETQPNMTATQNKPSTIPREQAQAHVQDLFERAKQSVQGQVNPATGQPYTDDEIMGRIKQKLGVK